MTLFAYLNGSDEAHQIRLNALGLTTRADGSPGVGGIVFDDEAGTLDVRGYMSVVVKETACTSAPVLFTGFIGDRKYSRSDGTATYKSGPSRFIDCNLLDQNIKMHHRVIGEDGDRPAETEADRINWLLATYLDGLAIDDGFVNSSSRALAKADYRGEHADDVLNDLVNTWIYFLYPIQPSGDSALFFDRPTAVVNTSTMSISNDLADITLDSQGNVTGTVLPPFIDAVLTRDPSETVSKMRLTYTAGVVTRENPTTLATYFTDNGLGDRGISYDTSRVNTQITAIAYANRYLDNRASHEHDSIVVMVEVPDSQAGFIAAGMLIDGKFTHFGLEGYDPAVPQRINALTINQAPGRNDLYRFILELDSQGRAGGGSGPSTGGFPQPPPTAAVHWYEATIDFMSDGGGSASGQSTAPFNTISSSDTSAHQFVVGTTYNYSYDFPLIPAGAVQARFGVAQPQASLPGIFDIALQPFTGTGSFTWNTPGTTNDAYAFMACNQLGHVPAHTTGHFWIDPAGWDPGGGSTAPQSGQWVYGETPTPPPGGGNRVFYTANPYAAGSLGVWVDQVDQTAAVTESDPATGQFTLAFDPRSYETITVNYQGI